VTEANLGTLRADRTSVGAAITITRRSGAVLMVTPTPPAVGLVDQLDKAAKATNWTQTFVVGEVVITPRGAEMARLDLNKAAQPW
jgi:hypothetical protein